MERVAFLVESTGERLGCLLNPESIEVSRTAGVRRRRSATGLLTGAAVSEDPILYTGGGRTDLNLDLLFDIGVAGSTIETSDVRDLTRPLWQLAETAQQTGTGAPAPIVRFLWGKSWNVPGVVTAVAERLEQFEQDGMPARSWLRMRLARVSDADSQGERRHRRRLEPTALGEGEEGETTHPVIGDEGGERLDEIAYRHYGDPGAWRTIADANALTDPGRLAPGTLLRIPRALCREENAMKAVALLPQVTVEAGGAPLGEEAMRELAEVRVSQRLSAPNQCELSFHGPVETEPLSPGASLRVVAGEDEMSLFSGQVTVVEHVFQADRDHETVVRAYDPLHRLRKSHRARALVQTTVDRPRRRTRRGARPLGGGRRLRPALAEPRAAPPKRSRAARRARRALRPLPDGAGRRPPPDHPRGRR